MLGSPPRPQELADKCMKLMFMSMSMSRQQFQRTCTCTSSYCAENHMCHAPECNFALKSEVPQCRAQLHVEQIMLLHSLVAHSRRQSIMFHAGESYDGTALKSTVHCRPMERCRHLVGRHALALVRTSPSAFHLSQLQTASFSAWRKELLWLQKELEAETLIKGRARALRIP